MSLKWIKERSIIQEISPGVCIVTNRFMLKTKKTHKLFGKLGSKHYNMAAALNILRGKNTILHWVFLPLLHTLYGPSAPTSKLATFVPNNAQTPHDTGHQCSLGTGWPVAWSDISDMVAKPRSFAIETLLTTPAISPCLSAKVTAPAMRMFEKMRRPTIREV